ncbi:MAG TPA: ThuA domain-containing protein [Candidatus Limnocylindria bacterium]|nr:ThuA domain-containing protein [Candidatus Limnocylindria bacterium]
MKLTCVLAALLLGLNLHAAAIRALIVDGQNNHDYKSTTPHLKKILEETGLFTVEVATTPPKGSDMSGFKPKFSDYRVIISNYNGELWSKETQDAFVEFVRNGGGFVSVHAADNAFPNWNEYNQMIGVGGWDGRNEKSGPYLRLRDGKFVHDQTPGAGGHHGQQHAFLMDTRLPQHPIMAGLPAQWMHAKDELYDRLRGPAENVTVLASALSAKQTGGSGEHEPLLMVISFGKGRVFHTALGHNNGKELTALKCVGFITTLQRGTEWAATGKVTQKVPIDFPTGDKVNLRE